MMKYLYLLIGILIASAQVNAQSDSLSLRWWRDKGLLASFPKDYDTLNTFIDSLSEETDGFKADFDSARKKPSFPRDTFNKRIKQYQDSIRRNICSIKKASFFSKEKGNDGLYCSFLFFYTNKELKDYLQSLDGLTLEMSLLFGRDSGNKLNVFNNANCINAYYSMTQSRSLLLAALDNLQRYYFLGAKADLIGDSVHVVQTSQSQLSTSVNKVDGSVDDVKRIANKSDSLLSTPFTPSFKLGKKGPDIIKSGGTDRISTAANAIIIHDRRTWWWRALLGGVVGGLVAGLIVHAAK